MAFLYPGPPKWSKLKLEAKQALSWQWIITENEIQQAIGGWVYFHETKNELASFGGKILDYQILTQGDVDMKQEHRVAIKFEIDPNIVKENIVWQGRSDVNAHYSGLV